MGGTEPGIIGMFFKKSTKYDQIIRKDKKETSVSFGVGGIISSVFTVAFAFLLAVGIATIASINGIRSGSFGTAIGLFISNIFLGFLAAVVGGSCAFLLIINSLMDVIYQFKMNKKPIRFVTLIIFLASVIASVALVILSF